MKFSKIDKRYVKKYLEDWEEAIYVIHKHWIEFVLTFIKWFIIWIIIPIFLIWLYPSMTMYLIAWMMFILFMWVYDFFDWYLDVLILTNLNLIHAEWNWFFKNFATRVWYESVWTVWFERKSVLSTVFDYWDLIIDAWREQIVFENTTNPKKAEFQIIDAKNKNLRAPEPEGLPVDKQWLKDLLSEIVEDHIQNWSKKPRWFWNN